jgi:hypothetical protein
METSFTVVVQPPCLAPARRGDLSWTSNALPSLQGEDMTTPGFRRRFRLGRAPAPAAPPAPPRWSIAFAPAFYGWPYYAGVASYLQRHDLLDPDARLIGTSAGVVIAAFLACGVDLARAGLAAALAANDAQVSGARTPWFRPSVVRRSFDIVCEALPADAHERASGRLVAVTCVLPSMRARAVSHFPTRSALLDAMVASMAVPLHGVRLAHRAEPIGWCIDGAFGFGMMTAAGDDRPGWRTVHVGVRRGRYLLPRRLDLEPSQPMPLRSLLAVESTERRMAWFALGEADAGRYFATAG